MASTHYVPIERRNLPSCDPLRWFILPVDTTSPVEAMSVASKFARNIMRLPNATIWAAVTYVPDFAHMQELRDEFDAVSDRKRNLHRVKAERVRNSFNTFSASAFA